MKIITTLALCALAAFALSVTFDTPVEAKPKPKVSKNIGKNFGKSMRKASKGVSRSMRNVSQGVTRSARWGARGVWYGTGIGAGAALATNNCNYYYRRYKDTGQTKWRNKYNNCIR